MPCGRLTGVVATALLTRSYTVSAMSQSLLVLVLALIGAWHHDDLLLRNRGAIWATLIVGLQACWAVHAYSL